MKKLKVAYLSQFPGYEQEFVFNLLQSLHPPGVETVKARGCDLLIVGPFPQKYLGTKLKPRRATQWGLAGRQYPPRILYHTGENTRWNAVSADYAISFDLDVAHPNHFRFPLWMAMFDWSHEGFMSPPVERFGPLVPIDRLMRPLGQPTGRQERGILISSHLREPRATLLAAVRQLMEVDCHGTAFDGEPASPKQRAFKVDLCRDKQFVLCPENSMYPGYYTEKIPDAFACGCIPITWCDGNVDHDFNPHAIINMANFASQGYVNGLREALQPETLRRLREEPLLLRRPSLDGIRMFLQRVIVESLA